MNKKTRISLDPNDRYQNDENADEDGKVFSFTTAQSEESCKHDVGSPNYPLPSDPPSTHSTHRKQPFNKDLVRLNVGGIRCEVSRDTLTLYEGSLLASLASTWNEDKFNSEIFVFRDGHLFAYVLDYLRSGKVHLPYSITRAALKEELDHFQIPADMNKIFVERDYFSIDRLNQEIKEHRAAIEEKEREVAAIIESYRLAHKLTASVSKHGFDWSRVVTPTIAVTPGIDKKLLHDCLLAQGVDVYGYQVEQTGAHVSLGPIQDDEKGVYCQTPTGSPFRFFSP